MNSIQSTLKEFGLTPNETIIYLASLKEDNLSPFKLAKITNIPRTTIYEILMSLSLKGLVTLEQSDGFTKQQTRVRAKNPSILREIIWEKRKKLSNLEFDIVNILPELKEDYHQEKSGADFRFYPGIDGVKKVYFEEYARDTHVPIYAFENLMPMDVFGRKETNKDVAKSLIQGVQKGIEINELVGLSEWAKHVLSYQYGRDKEYIKTRRIRIIESSSFFLNQRIVIHGNYVRISTAKESEVWGLIMKSPMLARSLESIFKTLWVYGEPVTPHLIESWGKNDFLESEKRRK